jgi:hypothetical protein
MLFVLRQQAAQNLTRIAASALEENDASRSLAQTRPQTSATPSQTDKSSVDAAAATSVQVSRAALSDQKEHSAPTAGVNGTRDETAGGIDEAMKTPLPRQRPRKPKYRRRFLEEGTNWLSSYVDDLEGLHPLSKFP